MTDPMKRATLPALVLAVMGLPALAQEAAPTGDPAAGEKVFAKCQACHVVADADGNVLAGRASKTGPNLYGLPGRTAGTYPDFRYGESVVELGATGFAWNEADFVAYVADPNGFLKEKLDNNRARSQMSFRLPKEEDALDVWAYIASLSPEAGAATN